MSEKFGLDWKQYDFERMLTLIKVGDEIEKYQEEQNKNKKSSSNQPKFRPRLK